MRFCKALGHFKAGLGYRYPLCCIITFCLNQIIVPDHMGAIARGCCSEKRKSGSEKIWVACRLHQLDRRWAPYEARGQAIMNFKGKVIYIHPENPQYHLYRKVT